MAVTTAVEVKSANSPDETRPFTDKGKAEVVKIAGRDIIRGTFEPGWKWSDHVRPLAGTETCQVAHFGYCQQGHMKVQMDDGTEFDMKAGDFVTIPPGHDAWIVGDETCVFIDFQGFAEYARK